MTWRVLQDRRRLRFVNSDVWQLWLFGLALSVPLMIVFESSSAQIAFGGALAAGVLLLTRSVDFVLTVELPHAIVVETRVFRIPVKRRRWERARWDFEYDSTDSADPAQYFFVFNDEDARTRRPRFELRVQHAAGVSPMVARLKGRALSLARID